MVIIFIGMDLLRASRWDWQTWLAQIKANISENSNHDEVQNFVLFTKVKFGKRKVVTGIEYATSSDRSIAYQWCYLGGGNKSGSVVSRLSLATVSKEGVKITSLFTPAALSQFGLNTVSVKALINSHCRFQ